MDSIIGCTLRVAKSSIADYYLHSTVVYQLSVALANILQTLISQLFDVLNPDDLSSRAGLKKLPWIHLSGISLGLF